MSLSPDRLEKLKIAREKALNVRQSNAKNKALEKELATAEKEQHYLEIKEKLAKVKNPASAVMGERLGPQGNKPQVKSAKKPPPEICIESDREGIDSDTEEPEVIVKKIKKKPKKKIIIVEETDSDEEQQQVEYVRVKKAATVPQKPPVPEPVPVPVVAVDPYEQQYNSIFGRR
jgi:hypothetical protein